MNLSQLLQLSYWFDLTPVRMSPAIEVFFFVLFASMIIVGSVFRIMRKNKTDKFERIILTRSANLNTVFGVLGLLWLFFSFQEISHFGMRAWFLIGLVAFIFFLVKLLYYAKRKVPVLRAAEQSKAEANKYLPRSNRR